MQSRRFILKTTHILYLSEVEGSSPFSGAENHLWTLLPAQVKAGLDVELICILWRGTDFTQVQKKLSDLEAQGIKIIKIKRMQIQFPLFDSITKLYVWCILWKYLLMRRNNIIHLHLEMNYTPFIAFFAGCRKLLFSIHNDEPIYRKWQWSIRLHVLKYIVPQYIAITDRVREYYTSVSGARYEKVTTVYYGVNPPRLPAYTRQEFGISTDAFVVGFVGRLVEQKNLFVFLEAIRRRPQVLAIIIGNGPLKSQLVEYAQNNNITNIRFLGAIPDAERAMPLFDVFCLPSLWEGLGLVLIEAMLRHIPILGSCRGAVPEILAQGKYGILFEPNSDDLVRAIDFAHDNPELLKDFSDLAYNYAIEKFTVENMVARTQQVYNLL